MSLRFHTPDVTTPARRAALRRARLHLAQAHRLEGEAATEALPRRRALLQGAAKRALDLMQMELRTVWGGSRRATADGD